MLVGVANAIIVATAPLIDDFEVARRAARAAIEAIASMSGSPHSNVLTDLFEELLVPNPEDLASIVIERLLDAGFEIRPASPKLAAMRPSAEETQPCQLTQLLRRYEIDRAAPRQCRAAQSRENRP